MRADERREYVKQQLEEKSTVTVSELSKTFKISEVSVRKILASMEANGELKRTWGGAVCAYGSLREFSHQEKKPKHMQEKRAIANAAYDTIIDGDAVFLDAGTTTLELAKLIVAGPIRDILVSTNSIHVAMELSKASDIQVIVIGGELRSSIYSCVGTIAEYTLKQLFFDKCFISANHFTIKHGVTTPVFQEAALKRSVLSVSKNKCFLLDSSKYGDDSLVLVAAISMIDVIFTDWKASREIINGFEEKDVKITVSQPL